MNANLQHLVMTVVFTVLFVRSVNIWKLLQPVKNLMEKHVIANLLDLTAEA